MRSSPMKIIPIPTNKKEEDEAEENDAKDTDDEYDAGNRNL
jgi:hypothetical protein